MEQQNLLLSLSDSAVYTRIDETSGVVLELDRKRYYLLNETSATIVETIQRSPSTTLEDLVDALQETFEVEREVVREDVRECLRTLEARNIVRAQP